MLADARQCAVSLADSFSRPRRAGAEYTLVPLRSTGAFHPKILLLVGKSKGLLCVGSHNLTLTGFGHNRELTNRIEFNAKSDQAAVATAQAVWQAVTNWLQSQHDYLPAAAIEAVLSLKNHAPWLEGSSDAPRGLGVPCARDIDRAAAGSACDPRIEVGQEHHRARSVLRFEDARF